MTFASLNPKISDTEISFDCPKCGTPHRIVIQAKRDIAPVHPVWSWSAAWDPSKNDLWDTFTITPSIMNHTHGRTFCGCHCSIVNGEVLP